MKSRAFAIALAFTFVWQTSLEVRAQQIQRLPATETFSTISRLPPANAFPPLPPPPEQLAVEPLPSLEDELARHGGSSLHAPEGEYLNEPRPLNYLQYETPQQSKPWTGLTEFQGAAPIEF